MEKIVSQIKNAQSGANITISMENATILPKEILETALGKDITLELQMNGYTWKILGATIKTGELNDINLEVKRNTTNIPSNLVSAIAATNPVEQISLTHDGAFGFTAYLTLNVGSQYTGRAGRLYYYNNGSMEFMNEGVITADGNVSLMFNHASDYAIVIKEGIAADTTTTTTTTTTAATTNATATNAPKTGDTQNMGVWYILLALSGICVAGNCYAVKKRRAGMR